MIKYVSEKSEIEFILSNLRDEDKEELENLFGSNWYEMSLESLKDEKFLVLYGYGNEHGQVPVAMGGFYEVNNEPCKIACVWLLSTKYINKNKTAFMKALRNQMYLNSSKYDILYNFIYKSNHSAKLWLKKLGFRFDNPHPEGVNMNEGFEFFYRKK